VPFTYKSLAFVWLITLGLFGLTASGVVAGTWLLLIVLVALAMPAFILTSQHRVGVIAKSPKPSRVVSEARDQSPFDLGAVDVSRWESEGGALRRYVTNGIRDSAKATRPPQSLVMTATKV
jgi:hypothetical protein